MKMVSKNKGQESTIYLSRSLGGRSQRTSCHDVTIFKLVCKILASLFKGFNSYLAMDLERNATVCPVPELLLPRAISRLNPDWRSESPE